MIAIDTNLLVYAHRPEMPFHQRAREVLTDAVGGSEPVSVPWPCAHEFLALVSNPRIFRDPTPVDCRPGMPWDASSTVSAAASWPREKATCAPSSGSARPALLQGAGRARRPHCGALPVPRRARALVRGPRLLAIPGPGGGQSAPRGLTAAEHRAGDGPHCAPSPVRARLRRRTRLALDGFVLAGPRGHDRPFSQHCSVERSIHWALISSAMRLWLVLISRPGGSLRSRKSRISLATPAGSASRSSYRTSCGRTPTEANHGPPGRIVRFYRLHQFADLIEVEAWLLLRLFRLLLIVVGAKHWSAQLGAHDTACARTSSRCR